MKPLPAHILAVDDKEENLYYLEALLLGHGCRVTTARHGAEALVKARQSPPNVIISDLLMPIMDGYTLLRHWKADPRLQSIPFLVYTATYTEPEDERLALNLGADAFILKPAEPDDFLDRLRHLSPSASPPAPDTFADIDDPALLKVYSQTLIRKLEEKTLQLEEANRALQADIASRQEVERSLRESEQRFRQLAETINEVFWITNRSKDEMLYVSPAYEKIWGRTCASLYDAPHTWLEAIHPEDRPRVEAALPQQQSGSYDQTYRILRPDGDVRWINDRAYPVTDESGTVYRIVGIAEDVTEKKRLEAQFLRTQRMESIGTLAGGIAHDLNNILAPILMSVPVLQSKILDPESQTMLRTLESCAQRGADLVRQVISFARGMEGKRITVNLRHLGEDIRQIVSETFPKTIDFHFSFSRDLWPVTGDPTQIHQIMMNLCVNARDAMPHGGRLLLRLENAILDPSDAQRIPDARPGRFVTIRVEDSGIGIPPDIRDRIFEPFFTTKDFGTGTGLGLSTTAAILKSHAGFIAVHSELGRGTQFHIFLPAEEQRPAAPELAPAATDLPRGQGEMILVVDDEEGIRSMTRLILEEFGFRVLLAGHGAEAVSLFARYHTGTAVVFTDMDMPIMDGPTTIAALRSIDPRVRVICSSGAADLRAPLLAETLGVSSFLAKPFTAAQLLRALHHALSG